jgi:hypothetical protein
MHPVCTGQGRRRAGEGLQDEAMTLVTHCTCNRDILNPFPACLSPCRRPLLSANQRPCQSCRHPWAHQSLNLSVCTSPTWQRSSAQI